MKLLATLVVVIVTSVFGLPKAFDSASAAVHDKAEQRLQQIDKVTEGK